MGARVSERPPQRRRTRSVGGGGGGFTGAGFFFLKHSPLHPPPLPSPLVSTPRRDRERERKRCAPRVFSPVTSLNPKPVPFFPWISRAPVTLVTHMRVMPRRRSPLDGPHPSPHRILIAVVFVKGGYPPSVACVSLRIHHHTPNHSFILTNHSLITTPNPGSSHRMNQ